MSLLPELAEIYRQLEESLPRLEGNPCGDCRECCTATGVDQHRVTELELDFIAERYGSAPTDNFRAFLARERRPDGELRWPLCPMYDETTRSCGIYQSRPFSCRVFGHFQVDGTALPPACVFQGKTQIVSRTHFVAVPMAPQLRDASRLHWPVRKPHPVRQQRLETEVDGSAVHSLLSELDPLDRAFMAQARDDHEAALLELNAGLDDSPYKPYLLFQIGQSLIKLERLQEASAVFQDALQLAPGSWELAYQLGVVSLQMERQQEAFQYFVQAVELNPHHSIAWGFLGYMTLSEGLLKQAATFFDNALGIDPDNTTFRLRLGVILGHLGYPREARKLLEEVLATPGPEALHAAARVALTELSSEM